MVVIDLLRAPIGRQLGFQQGMGRTNGDVRPDQPQALRHAVEQARNDGQPVQLTAPATAENVLNALNALRP